MSYSKIVSEWELAKQGSLLFIKEIKQRLSSVTYGCSFSPEHWDWAGYKSISHVEAITELSRWNIKDVRYGFRWSKTEIKPNQLDLSYYQPSFEALLDQKNNICLNVGIKTFHHPEAHVPEFYRRLIPRNRKITSDCELAKNAINYIHQLLSYLTQYYSAKELEHITCINPENEAISPLAGDPGLIITEEYLVEVCRVIRHYFPITPFLFNTAGNAARTFGGVTLEKLFGFIQQLGEESTHFGFDFYYKHPRSPVILSLPQPYDLIAEFEDKFGDSYFLDFVSKLERHNIIPEITELQAEPWGSLTTPGNSIIEFVYASRRALNAFFLPNTPALMRVWGAEYLIGNYLNHQFTSEQMDILKLIKTVNTK